MHDRRKNLIVVNGGHLHYTTCTEGGYIITALWVAHELRGRGKGKQLLNAAKRDLGGPLMLVVMPEIDREHPVTREYLESYYASQGFVNHPTAGRGAMVWHPPVTARSRQVR